ncbi:hypothetical protein LXA43DRAFT_341238 [Ganoderma leucocontextum]|nr:hypothetical protein LXA43DRAFT_341238 [Ganoderma leucocontextum]
MNAKIFSLLLLQTVFAFLVQATLYITSPLPATVCSGGKACTVEWFDDGVSPLLADIGACHVALYNGEQKLVQQINPVDVSAQHGLQFTPDPTAGPDSSLYYINFTSVNPVDGATYHQFSTMFTINSMTGSFNSPISSDASAVTVPSSLTASHSSSSISTVTIGATSSSTASASTTPSPSSSSSSSSSASLSSSSPSSSPSSSSSSRSSSSSDSASISSTSTSTSPIETASSISSSSSSFSSTSSSSASTSSGFVTSFAGPVTTLIIPAPSALGSASSITTAPSAPTSSTAGTTDINQTSSGFRTSAVAAMPFFLSPLVALTFGLLM